MPKGGARTRSGPPPAEHSRAKDRAAKRAAQGEPIVLDDGDWLTLPSEGRSGRAPAWPLPRAASPVERKLWVDLWKLPQAHGWEKTRAHQQVAVYVRTLVRADALDSAVALTNTVRLLADGLGLSAVGLRMLRWRIGGVPKMVPADPEVPAPAARSVGVSPRDRLTVIDGRGA